jgi:hypothetical protein
MNRRPRPPATPESGVRSSRRPFGTGPAVSLFTLGTMRALGSPDQMMEVLRSRDRRRHQPPRDRPVLRAGRNLPGPGPEPDQRESPRPHAPIWCSPARSCLVDPCRAARSSCAPAWGDWGYPASTTWPCMASTVRSTWPGPFAGRRCPPAGLGHWQRGWWVRWASAATVQRPLIAPALASGRFSFCSLHLHLFDQERLPWPIRLWPRGWG